ncbi:MAG: EndoU domain-containing protein [Gordonia sp. (in: high G+C Gram-positive bacteria)]
MPLTPEQQTALDALDARILTSQLAALDRRMSRARAPVGRAVNRRYLYDPLQPRDGGGRWSRSGGPRRVTHPFLTDPRLPEVMKSPRVRRHILDGEPNDQSLGGHRWNSKRPAKTLFPRDWTDDDVMDACAQVVLDPSHYKQQKSGDRALVREVNGVLIIVNFKASGAFKSAFPVNGVGVMRTPKVGAPKGSRPSTRPLNLAVLRSFRRVES